MTEAIVQGAVSRVRPVVMTVLMAAFGLLPMALSHAVGAETSQPFAVPPPGIPAGAGPKK